MKTTKFYRPEINPIYRDILLVMIAGFLVSLVVVMLGMMVFRGA